MRFLKYIYVRTYVKKKRITEKGSGSTQRLENLDFAIFRATSNVSAVVSVAQD